MSVHDLTTVSQTPEEYAEVKAEILRLMAPHYRRTLQHGRWELVLTMWEQGKTASEIGVWIGRSPSTVLQLAKRAFAQRMKNPEHEWPKNKEGLYICDIPSPMPETEDPRRWEHKRAITVTPRLRRKVLFRTDELALRHTPAAAPEKSVHLYCPVCRKSVWQGMSLEQVFQQQQDARAEIERQLLAEDDWPDLPF